MYDKKLSNEMGTFENRIRRFETAVSSIPRIHVSLDSDLALLGNLDKKLDSQPQVNDYIFIAMREIRHNLNTATNSSSAANFQRFRTLDAGIQGDHVNYQDFTDDE